MMRSQWWVFAIGFVALSCGDQSASDGSVTFGKDIAPLYNQKCVRCHQPGGIGPFRLDTYESARMMAMASLQSVKAKRMPPFAADVSGECGDLEADEAMSDDDVKRLEAWVEQGLQEGPATQLSLPKIPNLENAVSLKTPSFVPQVDASVAMGKDDEYRCFLVDTAAVKNRYVTGSNIIPGFAAIVHHLLLLKVNPNETTFAGVPKGQRLAELDAESPQREGWPCYAGVGGPSEPIIDSGSIVDWTPGQGVVRYPQGMGTLIADDDLLVAQVHYNLADPKNRGQADQTTIQLSTTDSVERRVVFTLGDGFTGSLGSGMPASLPPMQKNTAFTSETTFGEIFRFYGGAPAETLELINAVPHMHQRGRKMTVTATDTDGKERCLIRVTNYDFNWQRSYQFKKSVTVSDKVRFRTTCEYDTSLDSKPTLPGWGTQDEMCLPILGWALPKGR
jgi:hypothetical protein